MLILYIRASIGILNRLSEQQEKLKDFKNWPARVELIFQSCDAAELSSSGMGTLTWTHKNSCLSGCTVAALSFRISIGEDEFCVI